MDAEYSMICMADFGELTPLEVAVMYTHPHAYRNIRAQVDLGRAVNPERTGQMLYALWRRSNPRYRNLTAQLALKTWDEYHGNIGKAITCAMASLTESLVSGVHRPPINGFYTPNGIAHGMLELDVREGNLHFPSLERAVEIQFESIRNRIMRQTNDVLNAVAVEPQGVAQIIAETQEIETRTMNVCYQSFTDSGEICADRFDMSNSDLAGLDEVTMGEINSEIYRRQTVLDVTTAAPAATGRGDRAATPFSRSLSKATTKKHRKDLSMGRRALRRAYAFFMHQEREAELKLFVGGGNVEVSHEDSDLKFSLKRNQYLDLEKRSIPHSTQWSNIDVSILTKDDVWLCDVCVYIQDTPVLDQLMALIMLVEAGLEEQLIEKGNTKGVNKNLNFEELVLQSPALQAKLKKYQVHRVAMENAISSTHIDWVTTTATTNNMHYVRFVEDHQTSVSTYINTWITSTSATTVNRYVTTNRTSINTLHGSAERAVYWRAVANVQSAVAQNTFTDTNDQPQAIPV